jgi:hypothetical protein
MKRAVLPMAFILLGVAACTSPYSAQTSTSTAVGSPPATIRYRYLDHDPRCHDIEVFGIAGTSCSNY